MLRVLHQTPADIMEPRPEAGLPATLGRWVGEIVLSIPQPARRTVAELIVGGLLAGGGHVTQAFLALTPRLGWQAYHWMLEHGRFRLLGLVAALCGIVRRESHGGRCFAIIDDTLAPRASAKAPGAAVLRADRHRPVPRSWPRREDRVGQGLAAGRGRSPRTAVPAAGRLVYARLADPGGPAARARRRRPGPARYGAVRPAAAPRSGPAWPPEGVWREDRRRCRGPPAGRDAPHRRLRRPGSPSAPRRVPSAVPARRRRAGGLVRVGQAPGRLGEAAPAPLHGPGPVRAGGGRGLRAALGGGAPIRRAQADGRHGRDVAAGPQNAPALAAPGPDRPGAAGPADRVGGAGGARAAAGRWLAQAGDADAGPGQGRACPPVPRYPGFPPRARNPQENRPCSWYRPARERRRRMTSGSNPTSTALQEPSTPRSNKDRWRSHAQ